MLVTTGLQNPVSIVTVYRICPVALFTIFVPRLGALRQSRTISVVICMPLSFGWRSKDNGSKQRKSRQYYSIITEGSACMSQDIRSDLLVHSKSEDCMT